VNENNPESHPLLTPTEGWTLTPPDDSGTWEPFASLDGEDSDFYWIPKGCDDPSDAFDDSRLIPYPFGDLWCVAADLEALGFRVDL